MLLNRFRGFTLIELLIVVAIIAILAAIAVPNFLEAQTRAKVSRTRADMRTIATGLEAYAVDYNKYPGPYDAYYPLPSWGSLAEPPFHSRIPSTLTTPIAYITDLTKDVFDNAPIPTSGFLANESLFRRFRYWNYPYFEASGQFNLNDPNSTFNRARRDAGKYLFYSVGPDRDQSNQGSSFYTNYDATNGTISPGNIFRTQSNPEKMDLKP
jgi:prepilin-type N-terminal cleavage/methylation domain-containing protein